jgi:L-seryl-tRNA(Ser) seleniumtransferase
MAPEVSSDGGPRAARSTSASCRTRERAHRQATAPRAEGAGDDGAAAALTLAAAARSRAGTSQDGGAAASRGATSCSRAPSQRLRPRLALAAALVDIGNNDRGTGAGVRGLEAWEIEAALSPSVVAMGFSVNAVSIADLPTASAVCRAHGIPLIVDAAAQLPPKENLRRFIAMGADLVAFSGGKALGGPQASGILAGRATSSPRRCCSSSTWMSRPRPGRRPG